MEPRDLDRLVRQHARTAQLLGVDFVPAYRTTADEPAPAEAPDPPVVEVPIARPAPRPEVPEAPRPAARPDPRPAERTAPVGGPTIGAKDRAGNEKLLAALRVRYEAEAPHKAFDTTFNQIVFGEGDAAARLCFVGEAPGEDEDRTGRPFVGRAGQLLDKMIVAMGLARSDVYICNVLKTRPPGNRTPTQDEVAACRPYLLEQLAIVRPEVVVGLGLSATHALLESVEAMSRLRGRWWAIRDARGVEIPFMPTYHPAFLLRSYTDENRAKVWADLKMVMERLGLGAPAARA
jgi:DNA polymerase